MSVIACVLPRIMNRLLCLMPASGHARCLHKIDRLVIRMQALVDDISAAAYNVIFTSLPILFFAVLDRPLRNHKTMLRFPQARSSATPNPYIADSQSSYSAHTPGYSHHVAMGLKAFLGLAWSCASCRRAHYFPGVCGRKLRMRP